jgi:hypothetical protein
MNYRNHIHQKCFCLLILAYAVTVMGCSTITVMRSPSYLFKLNAELKAQGYYMAEFEFKMEAVLNYLNNGDYWRAYKTLERINHEMNTLEGLVKIPEKASPEELMSFLLDRQNPETGAFMNPNYPYFTYNAPTLNALDNLEALSSQTGRQAILKHPLKFLDAISTPEQLYAYMDSFLYFKEKWAEKFDGPAPYVAAVSELPSYDLFEKTGGYKFSDEWKDALRQWFYNTQDPKTGFWGARIGNKRKWRQSLDIDSTSHIIKLFLSDRGEILDPEFPLRHCDSMAQNLINEADAPVPGNAVAQHEWMLRQTHVAKIIVRSLWPHLPESIKVEALNSMPVWLDYRFSMFRPELGGFAVDASSAKADIDATASGITLMKCLGMIPGTWERKRLWGDVLAVGPRTEKTIIKNWSDATPAFPSGINSVRIYENFMPSEDSLDNPSLVQIIYPCQTKILDIVDFRQHAARFVKSDGGEFGNFSSKASLVAGALDLDEEFRQTPVAKGTFDLAFIARENPDARRFFVVGYNKFQIPVFSTEYMLSQ